jgi:hypothetical protein
LGSVGFIVAMARRRVWQSKGWGERVSLGGGEVVRLWGCRRWVVDVVTAVSWMGAGRRSECVEELGTS